MTKSLGFDEISVGDVSDETRQTKDFIEISEKHQAMVL